LTRTSGSRIRIVESPATRKTVAILCLIGALLQMIDQHGVMEGATYLSIGYGVLQIAAAVAGALLLTSAVAALGPLVGSVFSRGPGMSGADMIQPGWTQPVLLLTILVEGTILAISVVVLSDALHSRDTAEVAHDPDADAAKATPQPAVPQSDQFHLPDGH
jgi:hypothetical protein